uniref:Cyclin-O-like n=1 Tax=Crassostrea virginica TaxID=6565 RepID=A0A8B8E3Z8_CRAVI|nr:cyclin-O-like [Crassostrea virginica]
MRTRVCSKGMNRTRAPGCLGRGCDEGSRYSPTRPLDSPQIKEEPEDEDVVSLELLGRDQVIGKSCTPQDTDFLEPSLTDSGYNEGLHLQCLESVLDWRVDGICLTPELPDSFQIRVCSLARADHAGFEEHLDQIYQHRLSIEYKYQVTSCLDNQPEVTPGMRGLLISWLTGLHHQLNLSQDTLFVAVNIVDRVLDLMQASRDYLQLLGITSLLIACKSEEIHPPEIKELLSGCEDVYSRDQVKQLERVILNALRFDLLVPTSQFFLEYFSSCVISNYSGFHADRLRQARSLARYLLELTLQDYDLSQIRPSTLALCVWKSAVAHVNTDDGNFLPDGLFFTREDFRLVYQEVKVFTENLQQSFPEIINICDHYSNMYGQE